MYESILVPTDGSHCATAALEEALDIAVQSDGTIHSLYVADTSVDLEPGFANIVDAFDEVGEEVTMAAEKRSSERGVDITTAVHHGIPHQEILDYVADHDVDLIVMGTHGRTGLERHLLGSITEKVVRTASIPVLTVRGESADDDEGEK